MDAKGIKSCERRVKDIEEPIREIVPALWPLSYVIETGETCGGHVLSQPDKGYAEFPPDSRFGWYPHRATLEFAFSLNDEMAEARDKFRRDLRSVQVEHSGVPLRFDSVRDFIRDVLPYSRIPMANLYESYNATPPQLEKSHDAVVLMESLLASFLEEVATVVRGHNFEAKISPIEGKNFRRIIDWMHWR